MKAVVAAFNQEKALVGAFSVIVQPVVEPTDRFAALIKTWSPEGGHGVGVGHQQAQQPEEGGGQPLAGQRGAHHT